MRIEAERERGMRRCNHPVHPCVPGLTTVDSWQMMLCNRDSSLFQSSSPSPATHTSALLQGQMTGRA